MITTGMPRDAVVERYTRLCSAQLMAEYPIDTNSVIDADDIEPDADIYSRDQYRGRSKWSADQFSRFADSVGIENRSGQSAAVAHIITSMKQGNMQAARTRLQKLLATPGYMLDPDVAQVLIALDMVLKNDKPAARSSSKTVRVDTLYLIDTVYRDVTKYDTIRVPSKNDELVSPGNDTVYVDVVKYDTIYVDKEENKQDPMRNLAGEQKPEKQALQPQANSSKAGMNGDDVLASRVEKLTDEVVRLQQELQKRNQLPDSTPITRRCYTILISSHVQREKAEAEVQRIKRIFKRTRLAISNGAVAPFSVIVGYYESPEVANEDAAMVSRVTGQRCRAVATTIAERL